MCNNVFRKLNPFASSRLLSVSSTSSQNIKQPGGKSRFKSSGDVILSRSTNIVFFCLVLLVDSMQGLLDL